jgi:hypothetical protein
MSPLIEQLRQNFEKISPQRRENDLLAQGQRAEETKSRDTPAPLPKPKKILTSEELQQNTTQDSHQRQDHELEFHGERAQEAKSRDTPAPSSKPKKTLLRKIFGKLRPKRRKHVPETH